MPAARDADYYTRMIHNLDLHHAVGQAVTLKGPIGEGKTSLLGYLSSRPVVTTPAGEEIPVAGSVTLRLAGKTAEVINGIPAKGEAEVSGTTYTTSGETVPSWALEATRMVAETDNPDAVVYIYAQELNLAFPDTAAAFQDVLLDHRLPSGFPLPTGARFICDMNPRSEVSGVYDLSGALTNRLGIYDFEVPLADWTAALIAGFPGEGTPTGIHLSLRSELAGFITATPDAVYEPLDAVDRAETAWATKRSWTTAVDLLAAAYTASGGSLGLEDTTDLLTACVGSRQAPLFAQWLAGNRIPNAAQMVDNPAILDSLDDARAFAAVSSLVTCAITASTAADGTIPPATTADSFTSATVGVLNHLAHTRPDLAVSALLRLLRSAGLATHGPALVDPARVSPGFIVPSNTVDAAAFGPALSKVTTLVDQL